MITIVDFAMGNLGSICNMLKKVGTSSTVTSDPLVIGQAEKIILPGVGAFDKAISNLNELKLIDLLKRKVEIDKTPILGICLGMQLITNGSEEGNLTGFSWIDAQTKKFTFNKDNKDLKVPHMGWNTVAIHDKHNALIQELPEEPRFYFVHSYFVECRNSTNILTTTSYGNEFVSAICYDNIYGVQFHPEKSHKFGMKILSNFVNLC